MDGTGIDAADTVAGMRDVACLGLMVGSAIVSPVLVDASTMWRLDMSIFILSCGGFSIQHRESIKKYGPLMIPITTLLGLVAYSSARTPLGELVPWMPIALSLLLLLTCYSLPHFCSNFDDHIPLHHQPSLEDGPPQVSYSSSLATSGSDHQTFSTHGSRDGLPLTDWSERCVREYQVGHMSRSTTHLSQLPSVHESDIDLDEPVIHPTPQWVSQWISLLSNAPQRYPELQTAGIPIGLTPLRHGSHGYHQGPSTSSTASAQCPSESARSESPLLEQVPHKTIGP